MKIGFDVSQTGDGKAGCGFFADNLIRHLALIDTQNQYYLYPTFGDHYWDNEFDKTTVISANNFQRGLKQNNSHAAKKFWRNPPTTYDKQLGNVDILHANNFFCPEPLKNGRLIYTLYDLSFVEYPDCTTDHNRIACFNGVFKASLYADRILAISHYSKQHFLALFPHYPAEKIEVIHPASRFNCTKVMLPPTEKLKKFTPNQFWLSVGTLEPRKNVKYLLQSYAKLKQQGKTLPLVLAGKPGWILEDIHTSLNDMGLREDVHVLGYVDNEELQWLYQNCFCFVYPSLFEGFGLPILEAMTFGAAVITSNSSSLPEVAGQAGLLINPHNEQDLVDAMIKVSSDPKLHRGLKELALQQAQMFSWESTAKKVLNLYEQVLTGV